MILKEKICNKIRHVSEIKKNLFYESKSNQIEIRSNNTEPTNQSN